MPLRYSRHYYDLAMMAADPLVKMEAFSDLNLLHTVAEFKAKFYPASWANYNLAKPGTFKLMPSENRLRHLANDYTQMQVMFLGDIAPFHDLSHTLQGLENEINTLEGMK